MKPLAHSLPLVFCALLAACDGGRGEGLIVPGRPGDGSGTSGTESVQLAISIAGAGCAVASANAMVTGWDMAAIGPVPLTVTGDTVQGTITGVPAGTSRTVSVTAYDGRNLAVFQGSAVVDVVAGQTANASIVLSRTGASCDVSTGDIAVTGTIEGVAFSFTDAALTSNGVIQFFDAAADRIRRLDLASRQFLPDLSGSPSLDAISMAAAPDGSVAYLGYVGGRMDAVDLGAGTLSFFAAAASTVSTMVVAGDYLFTIDESGAWNTQSLYHRGTRARMDAADWRDSSRSIVYSPARSRVYSLDSGVSPTDVNMTAIDHATGKLGPEVDSPYHGSYSLPNPLRLLPDESGVIVGSGIIFEAADLTFRTSLGLTFEDIAFLGDRIYLIDTIGETTELRTLTSTFDIVAADYFPGTARRLFAHAGELVLVTAVATGFDIRFLAP